MPVRKRLTDAGIARLRAQAREYTVWDTQLAGLGVRVRPSGSRTFIYHCRTNAGMRKMSFGPAAFGKVEEVRRACLAAASEAVAAVETDERPREAVPLFRDFVCRPLEGGPLRPLQAFHAEEFRRHPETPAASRLRVPPSRPDYPQDGDPLVRDL